MSEEAKAVQEVAKLGQRSLDTLDKAGGWTTSVFGEGINNLAGAWADNTAGIRLRNRIRVLEKTQKAIDASSFAGRLRLLPERIALPLLEAISEESDETLQDVWAAYIRNAADPLKPPADRLLIDLIRRLEPVDWPVLSRLFDAGFATIRAEDLGQDEQFLVQTMDRLTALGLFTLDDDTAVYRVTARGEPRPRLRVQMAVGIYEDTRLFYALRDAAILS